MDETSPLARFLFSKSEADELVLIECSIVIYTVIDSYVIKADSVGVHCAP